MFDSFANLPRSARRSLLLLLDTFAILVATWAAFALRLGQWWPRTLDSVLWVFVATVIVCIPIFWAVGMYRSLLRYGSRDVVYAVVQGVSLSMLLMIALWVFFCGGSTPIVPSGRYIPRSTWPIFWFVLVATLGGIRFLLSDYFKRRRLFSNPNGKRVIIYGAGVAGVQLATALQQDTQFSLTAFIDDSPEVQGNEILGLQVFAPDQLLELVRRRRVETVLLAVPSTSHRRRREILDELAPMAVQVMIMPSLGELADGKKSVAELREVDIEDLLGRESIDPQRNLLASCIRDRVVMVTGAGGSIGSELCRQVLKQQPRRLVLFELSEYALYSIERELRSLLPQQDLAIDLIPILGSVSHRNRVQAVMETFAVETVYHAAAYKHVPIVEHNPIEGVRNNIFGTYYTAQAAIAAGVGTFVLISTDKAVRPTNVMGATKRFAELVLQALARQTSDTRFSMVRFGNVLASSGSVVPLFREQIGHGGPVTVTHPDMVRYFMTIPEAAQLVIQAGSMASDGDVFLLDMGEPVNITSLARRMIELSGFEARDENNPGGDIEIRFTGLRSGEKLYEELLIGDDDAATQHPRIRRAAEEFLPWSVVGTHLERLDQASREFNYYEIRDVLLESVSGYQPRCGIEDWVWVERGGTAA